MTLGIPEKTTTQSPAETIAFGSVGSLFSHGAADCNVLLRLQIFCVNQMICSYSCELPCLPCARLRVVVSFQSHSPASRVCAHGGVGGRAGIPKPLSVTGPSCPKLPHLQQDIVKCSTALLCHCIFTRSPVIARKEFCELLHSGSAHPFPAHCNVILTGCTDAPQRQCL